MIAPMTDYQIAEVALSKVLATLPCERKLLEQANHTALPFMFGDGSIHGPAADNAAVLVEYPNDWQGLAVSINAGNYRVIAASPGLESSHQNSKAGTRSAPAP